MTDKAPEGISSADFDPATFHYKAEKSRKVKEPDTLVQCVVTCPHCEQYTMTKGIWEVARLFHCSKCLKIFVGWLDFETTAKTTRL